MKNKSAKIAGISAFVLSLIPVGDSFYKSMVHYKNSEEIIQKFDPKNPYTNQYSLEALFERQKGNNERIKGFALIGFSFPISWLTYKLFQKEENG